MNLIKLHQDKPVTAANLVWEEPPAKTGRGGKYAEFAQALRENPGRWAVMATFRAGDKKRGWSLSNHVNAAKFVDFRDGTFEATCRSVDDETRVYVRHLPAVDAQGTTGLAVAR
ncbi:MAG TPA: hypothetical protein VGF17_24555 [Phytomonospora sp.]